MKSSITFCLLTLLLGWAECLPARTFTDNNGRKIEAEISEIKGESVVLLLGNGSKSTVPLAKLSAADLMYIGVWQKENSVKPPPAKTATFTPSTVENSAAATAPDKAGTATGPALPEGHKFRLKAVVNPVKKTKGSGSYYYDSKEVRSTLKVDIRNDEINNPLNGAKARLVSFSRDLRDKDSLKVLHCEDYELNLKPGETFSQETEEVKLQFYDSSDYKYGDKYYGHILAVQHNGKTILMDSSQPSLGEYADKIWKLSKEDRTNAKLDLPKVRN